VLMAVDEPQNVGWVRRGFLRRNPTNPILPLKTGFECLGLLGYAIKPLTQPTWFVILHRPEPLKISIRNCDRSFLKGAATRFTTVIRPGRKAQKQKPVSAFSRRNGFLCFLRFSRIY
jgi:hypothetical protein